MWVSRYLENILKSTQDKYKILILFSPGLAYIIRECQCDLIWALFSMTLNYQPIKIIFYVKNYYVRDWQCHLQQAIKSQYQLGPRPSTDKILQLHVTSSVCLHHLFNIFEYIRNSYTYMKMLVNPMYDS